MTVVRAGRRILDEVIASIPAAGITVVSGPSGADKTMLLIRRLFTPDHRLIHLAAPADHLSRDQAASCSRPARGRVSGLPR